MSKCPYNPSLWDAVSYLGSQVVDQRDGVNEKQSIVPWPQSIPELEWLGTWSTHPGPSLRSPPALSWQLPSGHSSCHFLRSLSLLALSTESSLYGAELCSRYPFPRAVDSVSGPERRVSPRPHRVSCLQAHAPLSPPRLSPPGRACSSGALLSLQGSKDQKSHPFPLAPKSLLFNQLPRGGKGGVSSPCVTGITLSEASEQTPSSWLTGHDFSSFL